MQLSSKAEVPQRPHKEVRQCAKTGQEGIFLKLDLYSAHLVFWCCQCRFPLMLADCEFLFLCEGNTFSKHVLVFRLPANTARLLHLYNETFWKHVLVFRLQRKNTRLYTLWIMWDILKTYFCAQVAREDCQTVPVQKCESVKDEQCRNVPRQVMRYRKILATFSIVETIKFWQKLSLTDFPLLC